MIRAVKYLPFKAKINKYINRNAQKICFSVAKQTQATRKERRGRKVLSVGFEVRNPMGQAIMIRTTQKI